MIKHFLLVYDHARGKLADVLSFGTDSTKALKKYEELEAENRDVPTMDIVLVGSDSLETIKVTHRNYFDEGRTMADIENFLKDEPRKLASRY